MFRDVANMTCHHTKSKNVLRHPSPEEISMYLGVYPYKNQSKKIPPWAELLITEDGIGEIRVPSDLADLPDQAPCRAIFLRDEIGAVVRWAKDNKRGYFHQNIERGDGGDSSRSGYITWCSKCGLLTVTS